MNGNCWEGYVRRGQKSKVKSCFGEPLFSKKQTSLIMNQYEYICHNSNSNGQDNELLVCSSLIDDYDMEILQDRWY